MREQRSSSPLPRAALLAVALSALVACGDAERRGEPEPGREALLLREAIRAHGGEARMDALRDLRVVAEGVYRGRHRFRRVMHYGSRDDWSMTVSFPRDSVTVGMDREGGWESEEHLVRADDQVATSPRGLTAVLAPLRLPELARGPLRDAGTEEVGGREVRAIVSGDVTILLDPETKWLVGLRYPEEMVETFADFEPYAGVVLPRRRSLFRGSEPDAEERTVEIAPAGTDLAERARPPAIHAGMIVDETLPAGSIGWTEVEGGWDAIDAARQALEVFARSHDAECCREGHLSLTSLGASSVGVPRWRVAIHLTAFERVEERTEGALHLENHDAAHVIGRFEAGGFEAALEQAGALEALAAERGYVRAPESEPRVLCYRGRENRPDCGGVTLLLTAVTEREQP